MKQHHRTLREDAHKIMGAMGKLRHEPLFIIGLIGEIFAVTAGASWLVEQSPPIPLGLYTQYWISGPVLIVGSVILILYYGPKEETEDRMYVHLLFLSIAFVATVAILKWSPLKVYTTVAWLASDALMFLFISVSMVMKLTQVVHRRS